MFGLEQHRLSISYGFPFHHCDRQEIVKDLEHSKHNLATSEKAHVKKDPVEILHSLPISLSEIDKSIILFLKWIRAEW